MRMRYYLGGLYLAMLLATAGILDAHAGNRLALVIGNQNYETAGLKYPLKDAETMGAALSDVGFSVMLHVDLGWREMNDVVEEFSRRLYHADVGLFYYAGHGVQSNGKNYLIPIDSDIRYETDLRYKAVDADMVIARMEGAGNKTNIVILDACRSNTLYRGYRSGLSGLAYRAAPPGTLIAYSTGSGQKASDAARMYTYELAKYIRTPGIRLVDIFAKVRRTVRERSGGLQLPCESTSLEGPFYFIPPSPKTATCRPVVQTPARKPAPATPPPPPPVVPAITPPASGNPKPVAASNAAADIYMEEIAGLELVRVNGGCYAMGCGPWSPECDGDERPVHEVCVDDFWIGLYEVTNEQYLMFLNEANTRGPAGERWFQTESENPKEARITGETGRYRATSGYEKHPVACVSWYGANAYVRWLSKKTGLSYSLPTEAEWEYAARSGGRSEPYAGGDNVDRFAWYSGNSGDTLTEPVGQLEPNGLGIFDMSGNVWEWVADGYSDTAYLKHTRKNPLVDLLTGTEGPEKGIRGGSWRYEKSRCRTTNRGSHAIAASTNDLGFRVVMRPKKGRMIFDRNLVCRLCR